MERLVIVSNRVPDPTELQQPAGGLAVALADALRMEKSSLWFGWSGQISEQQNGDGLHSVTADRTTYVTTDLTRAQHRGYYQRYSNGIVWPLFHYRAGLMDYSRTDWEAYRAVNRMFAEKLMPLLRPGDTIWVQDYHLFLLAQELRALGATCPIGFFLHIPFPPWSLFRALPFATDVLKAMASYDQIGLQTREDAYNLNECFRITRIEASGRAFPIGIDPVSFAEEAITSAESPEARRLQASLRGKPLIIGVDRLDYSKGLEERFLGYQQLLRRFPEHRGNVTYLQITPVSRGEVEEYRLLRRKLDEVIGRINGTFSNVDWTPIRYLTHPIPRPLLAGFYRLADIALVTPLRDGMNLVAKEFIAAQDEADPGVLVLSDMAGAAPELPEALLVNPHDPDDTADALHRALKMPEDERRARWKMLDNVVRTTTAGSWARDFLAALRGQTEPRM
ncbi:trehalose-6-phosphate synthase [Acetobacter sp. AN02]|uniref:alpha,alpha-trehalose-phosphate synthase (UDP-forming) n=1 Tax=Acetobacter sp. AN02 TaxID=2894186 RepID=UPI0024345491|nr:trehalose-6-phosphate synthase [Acetobacter sp. AN02]MDG6094839.1 trehalose-6-phosphate synthase [Acetobacter sp. AN02]